MTTGGILGGARMEDLRRRWGVKWSSTEDGVIAAWIADADAPVCPAVRVAVEEMLEHGDLTYPPDDAGSRLAEVFAARSARHHGWEPDPAKVVVTTDLIQAMSLLVDRLTDPGDGVMLHTPAYPPFLDELDGLGRRVVPLPWERVGDGWATDPSHLLRAADAGHRVLILVNPHNPTGRVWRRDELEALATVVADRGMVVIADEIHADLTHDPHRHVPFASIAPEVGARTVTLTSASKSHNLPGVRCCVAHVGESPAFDAFRRIPPSQIGQVSNVGFLATLAAWEDGDEWLSEFRRELRENRDAFAASMARELPLVDHAPAEATYLAWLDCRPLGLPGPSPAQFFLERARVALSPGEAFGDEGVGRVRVNLATSPAILTEVAERMVTAVDLAGPSADRR